MFEILLLATLLGNAAEEPCKFKNWDQAAKAFKKNDFGKLATFLDKNSQEDNCPTYKQLNAQIENKIGENLEKKKVAPNLLLLAASFYKFTDGAQRELVSEYIGLGLESETTKTLKLMKDWGITCTPTITKNYGDYGAMPEGESKQKDSVRKSKLESVKDKTLEELKKQCLTFFK